MKVEKTDFYENLECHSATVELTEELLKKQKRNKEIGDEVRSRVVPFIREVALKYHTNAYNENSTP